MRREATRAWCSARTSPFSTAWSTRVNWSTRFLSNSERVVETGMIRGRPAAGLHYS